MTLIDERLWSHLFLEDVSILQKMIQIFASCGNITLWLEDENYSSSYWLKAYALLNTYMTAVGLLGELVCYWSLNWSQYTYPSAAAAKSLQSCLTLCDPVDGNAPGSPLPGILQARKLEWVAISFSNAWKWKVKVKSLSHVQLFTTPWTAAYQAPPSMGFSRQEYWSGVPSPSPENVPSTWQTWTQAMPISLSK